jgi:putative transcriptional regulator
VTDDDELAGKLLVSLPIVREDTFYRTVIFLLRDGPVEGSLGVVLNRPSEIDVAEIFPALAFEAADPRVLFNGGPVQPDGIICLARGPSVDERPGFTPVLGTWGSIDPRETPPDGVDNVRVYRGYAGWAPRQLADELARGSWLVCDALPDDVTSDEPEDLWTRVIERQGPRYAKLKQIPRDPSLN